VKSFTSAVGSGAGTGGSSFFSLLIALMAKNKTPAMIKIFSNLLCRRRVLKCHQIGAATNMHHVTGLTFVT
jgi:hypothetical protein